MCYQCYITLKAYPAIANGKKNMSEYKPCMLRLSVETHHMLREAVEKSAHRSMSALADEIIYTALARVLQEEENRTSVDRMISAARR